MEYLKNRFPKRFIKFSIVGAINFFIDFFILNLLSFVTGISRGIFAAGFSGVSFLIANINSYYLNKRWTFKGSNNNSKFSYICLMFVGRLLT